MDRLGRAISSLLSSPPATRHSPFEAPAKGELVSRHTGWPLDIPLRSACLFPSLCSWSDLRLPRAGVTRDHGGLMAAIIAVASPFTTINFPARAEAPHADPRRIHHRAVSSHRHRHWPRFPRGRALRSRRKTRASGRPSRRSTTCDKPRSHQRTLRASSRTHQSQHLRPQVAARRITRPGSSSLVFPCACVACSTYVHISAVHRGGRTSLRTLATDSPRRTLAITLAAASGGTVCSRRQSGDRPVSSRSSVKATPAR